MDTTENSSYLLKLTLVATLGGFLFGYDTAVISGTVSSLDKFFVLSFLDNNKTTHITHKIHKIHNTYKYVIFILFICEFYHI